MKEPGLKLKVRNVIGGGDQEWAVVELVAEAVCKNGRQTSPPEIAHVDTKFSRTPSSSVSNLQQEALLIHEQTSTSRTRTHGSCGSTRRE